MEKILTMLVGLLIALGGWSLSRTFELSTIQAVHDNKIEQLELQLRLTEEKLAEMADSDEEIMEQHEKLFKALAKKMGKDKSMSILQKMAYGGGDMPKDVTQLMQARMGKGSMIDPELSMAGRGKNMDEMYGYGGMVKKKKKSKKKK